jgi:DNA repair exonuclease SbcCD ATPase subunit
MFNPPITDLHGGYDDLSRLLAIIKDPDTHKKRLDELIAQEAATKKQIAALNEMADETRRLNTAAQATTIVLNNRKTALDAREAELAERAKNLELSEATRSDAALRRREAAVQTREAAATREADRLAAIRTDLETKLEKIKRLTTGLT